MKEYYSLLGMQQIKCTTNIVDYLSVVKHTILNRMFL